ncbi:DUF4292 domain-containing protein [uncultured Cyclobacterium sp.]|uniref:DUF4292 domain-containing protein n=1 Tax=uncultured Cyclobacterium sp. TaxID=453820 RepID=UPI0030EC7F19|tara:strand:+ start:34979 stop:35722 length:744 start_codon:yes stop_codon:yes gene_type:complete
MSKAKLFTYLLGVVMLWSCARKPMSYTTDKAMDEFQPNYLDFNYLSAKGRITLEEQDGKITKGVLNLRAKKDSVIWFNMSPGLGIEALRGYISTDRIKIRDRINGQKIDMDYAEFQKKYGVPLSFSLFQNLLFANLPHEFSYRDRLIRVGKTFVLKQERENITYETSIDAGHGKVTQLKSIASQTRSGSLEASYMDFRDVSNQPFPYQAIIKMVLSLPERPKSNFFLNVEMIKVELTDDPLNFPYNF